VSGSATKKEKQTNSMRKLASFGDVVDQEQRPRTWGWGSSRTGRGKATTWKEPPPRTPDTKRARSWCAEHLRRSKQRSHRNRAPRDRREQAAKTPEDGGHETRTPWQVEIAPAATTPPARKRAQRGAGHAHVQPRDQSCDPRENRKALRSPQRSRSSHRPPGHGTRERDEPNDANSKHATRRRRGERPTRGRGRGGVGNNTDRPREGARKNGTGRRELDREIQGTHMCGGTRLWRWPPAGGPSRVGTSGTRRASPSARVRPPARPPSPPPPPGHHRLLARKNPWNDGLAASQSWTQECLECGGASVGIGRPGEQRRRRSSGEARGWRQAEAGRGAA
jgi:hypothetical protein